MSTPKVFTYDHAELERIIDGDTIDVAIDVGFHFSTRQRLRLLDYDTPERGEPGFREASDQLATLLAAGDGRLTVSTVRQDSFGRWLSRVTCAGVDINEAMRQWLAETEFGAQTSQNPG